MTAIGIAGADGPLVVVVDDLHWIDTASARSLLFALRRLWADPVCVLMAARPGTPARLGESWERLLANPDRASTLRLRGLDPAQVRQLAAARGAALRSGVCPRVAVANRPRNGRIGSRKRFLGKFGSQDDKSAVALALRRPRFSTKQHGADNLTHAHALSVPSPSVGGMRRFVEEDLSGAEFRECEFDGARFVGVVMQHVDIDGLVNHLVVNGVEVSQYVNSELDRRYPVRLLIRSDEPVDLRNAWRQLDVDWATTIARIRQTPGVEQQSVNGEWSAVQTLRHLVFVHDSWFRRCCLGSIDRFTPMGIGPSVEPYRRAHGLDPSLEPSFDEVVTVRRTQAAELESWLESVTPEVLAAVAPVPGDDVWPPYARGRTVRQCLGTVLNEHWEHHRFTTRDLNLIGRRSRSV